MTIAVVQEQRISGGYHGNTVSVEFHREDATLSQRRRCLETRMNPQNANVQVLINLFTQLKKHRYSGITNEEPESWDGSEKRFPWIHGVPSAGRSVLQGEVTEQRCSHIQHQ